MGNSRSKFEQPMANKPPCVYVSRGGKGSSTNTYKVIVLAAHWRGSALVTTAVR